MSTEKAHRAPERWNNLPKVTEQESGPAKTNTQLYLPKLENTIVLDYKPPCPLKRTSSTQKENAHKEIQSGLWVDAKVHIPGLSFIKYEVKFPDLHLLTIIKGLITASTL